MPAFERVTTSRCRCIWAMRATIGPRSAYLPFGGGRRICIGQSFALMEMVLMASIMSQRFTFDVCHDHPVELEATLTLRPKHGLHVIAHRREELADER